jgi:hypothetical protein
MPAKMATAVEIIVESGRVILDSGVWPSQLLKWVHAAQPSKHRPVAMGEYK